MAARSEAEINSLLVYKSPAREGGVLYSWERGTNENTNGLVRQYFPKKTNFATITHGDVRCVERLLNNRPRKCLDFKTPNQVFRVAS